jgi:PAS domain S-box-containing protein
VWGEGWVGLTRLVRTLFALVLVALATMGALELRSLRRVVVAADWVEHTLTVEKELGALLASSLDAGSEYREFVHTGTDDTIARIVAANAASIAHVNRIELLTRDNALQQRRIVDLRHAVEARIAFGAEVIASGTRGLETARALLNTGESTRRLRSVRYVLDSMTSEEERLLSERNQLAISNANTANKIALSLCLTVLVTIVVSYVLVRHNTRFMLAAGTNLRQAEVLAARLLGQQHAEDAALRLAAIVTSSNDAIIGESLDGRITSWNHGAEKLFGYEAAEVIGKPISLLVPEGREDEERSILENLRKGEGLTQFETVRRHKDGRDLDVSITLSPIRSSSGELLGASKVARDISDRKRAELALVLANSGLESFSYSVAHDLRAPLRGMSGFAQILLDDYGEKLDAEGRDCLHEIHNNALRMASLIDALLSLARVSRSDLKPEWTDLSVLARNIGSELAVSDGQHHVQLVVEEGLCAQVDPRLCRNLLDNLLGNAWKFVGKTANPRIEFGSTDKEGVRAFFVRDNGAGFDMAYAQKLFEPFQRLHTVREFPGTGIGLATVQRIVHRHGGRVWAEGSVDAGATFLFTLPAQSMGASV